MKRTIEDLKLLSARTPFADYFGTLLDMKGEWTQEMIDSQGEAALECETNPPCPLVVWEGSCEIETHDVGTANEYRTFAFDGIYRAPLPHEWICIASGVRPFSGEPYPHEPTIVVPETSAS